MHDKKTEPFAVESAYLPAPVLGGRRLALQLTAFKGDGDWNASFIVDPNTCTLDPYGDRAGCTRIAVQSHPVKLRRLAHEDPAGQGRRLYVVEGAPTSDPCHFVADRQWKHFRLVIGGHTVIPLQNPDRVI